MKNNKEKVLSFLGLATRAGKIVSGDDSTLLDLKKGKVNLILIAEDASNNTNFLKINQLLEIFHIYFFQQKRK